MKNIGFLKQFKVKYVISAAILIIAVQMVFGAAFNDVRNIAALDLAAMSIADSVKPAIKGDSNVTAPVASTPAARTARQRRRMGVMPLVDSSRKLELPDSATMAERDSLRAVGGDTISVFGSDSTAKKGGSFLEDIISGKNTDSLVYDVKNKLVYIYNEGDVTYQNMNLKADFMRVNMDTKEIYAYGKPDSVDGKPTSTHPVFTEGQASYTMDTITYNISSKKAKIKGVATQEGDGWLVGGSIKKMADNTINIQHGKYTTCDHTDHPHF